MQLGPIDLKIFGRFIPAPLGEETSLPAFLDQFQAFAMSYAFDQYGIEDLREAWCTFRAWMNPELDPEAKDWRLFLHWYVFHWLATPTGVSALPAENTVAEKYSKAMGDELSAEQKEFLLSAIRAPMDFYEVYWLADWDCFYLKSMLLGQERSFAFPQVPAGIKDGDIFFAKVVPLHDDRGVLAAYSRIFDASAKVPIARLRQDLIRVRKDDFMNNFNLFDSDVFNLYHDLLDENKDGVWS